MQDLMQLPVSQLRSKASELGIKNASRYRKPDLVNQIELALNTQSVEQEISQQRIEANFDVPTTFGPHNENFRSEFDEDVVAKLRSYSELSPQDIADLKAPTTTKAKVSDEDKRPKQGSKSEKIIEHYNEGFSKYKVAQILNTYYSVVDGVIKRYPHLITRKA